MDYGGGPSFDDVYATPLLDWTFEWRNVGRHDGTWRILSSPQRHGPALGRRVDRGDEVLEALIGAAMAALDNQSTINSGRNKCRPPLAGQTLAPLPPLLRQPLAQPLP
jgi:hypothetical protein